MRQIQEMLASAVELKSRVWKMVQEGVDAVAQLRAEVQNCRTRIEEAEQTALVEPLTGLANRRALEAPTEFRIAQMRRFSLLMLDLNGFKNIDDTYGHLAGDQVIEKFAPELNGIFRLTDSIGR